MDSHFLLVIVLLAAALVADARDSSFVSGLRLPSSEYVTKGGAVSSGEGAEEGTKWALLIAGSSGYWNYRHQADVCHAYQLLKRDGLKDENIVTFMFDDIAENEDNPRPGTIINHPQGKDVYKGVPKDYTGKDLTVSNFLAALLGNASAIKGGSGKVINSGPNDHVFVYYTDHGGPGILGMPFPPFLMADDVVGTLKKKHANKGFKELVFYLEACESGSIFQGLLPTDINVYAVTAANADESSWGTYCPGMDPAPPEEYDTCLGDLFSVAWMEDSDTHNLYHETLKQQYHLVKSRTAGDGTYFEGSHVMRYGNKTIDVEDVAEYIGSDPNNDDKEPDTQDETLLTWVMRPLTWLVEGFLAQSGSGPSKQQGVVEQREADMLHLKHKYLKAVDPVKKAKALAEYTRVKGERETLQLQVESFSLEVSKTLGQNTLLLKRGEDSPLVDDWQCLRQVIRAYEGACGPLTQFGMQFTSVFAAVCNSLGNADAAVAATAEKARSACGGGVGNALYAGPYSV